MDLHVLRVVHDGRVVAGNLLDGVVVIARRVVADCLEGDLAVLVILDGLDHVAILVEQLEREVAPCELATREALRRLERYRGLLRVVRVREGLVSTRYLRCGRQRAGAIVRDRHLVDERMGVVDHARLRARLLRDGVGEVLARSAAQVGERELARELHRAIGLVRRGAEHLAVGVLQLERVFAALQLGVVREARRDRNDLGRRQLHGSLCGVGVREGGGIGLVTIVGNSGVQLAGIVHDLHHGMVHRSVVGHVGQVALLFRDGVFVLAGLGVVDGREGDGAVLAVLGAPDGLLALQLLSRQVALVQVEGELAALERGRRVVGLHIGLLRRERHRGLGGLVLVSEGRGIVLAVIGDGRLRLVALRLHRDVNLHRLGVVGDGRIAASDLLERVVVLAQVQALDGQLDLAILIVGAASVLIAVLVVQAEGERIGRQVLARENFRGLNGDVRRRLRVGEGRHGLIAAVGGGCAQLAVLVIGDADLDLHFLTVVDDGLVVTGNFLDGVLVVTGLGVADGLEGNVAVLVVRDGLKGRAFRLVTLVQSKREIVPRERTALKVLHRRQGHGTLRGIAVGKGGEVHLAVLDLRRFALVIAVLFHRHACDSQLGILVLNLHRDGVGGIVHRPTGVLHAVHHRVVIGVVRLGKRERVCTGLVELHAGEVDRLAVLTRDRALRGPGLRMRVARQVIRHRQVVGSDLRLHVRRGSQRERELLVRALGAGDLLRYLRGQLVAGVRLVAVGEHQLVVFGQRAVGILRGNRARDAIAFFSQILVTLIAAGQLIARGHLVLAGQLLHRVIVTLGKAVHANRLVGLDGLRIAVRQVEHVADPPLARSPRLLEHCGLVRLPHGHGELEGEPRVLIARQTIGHDNLLRHLEARLAFVRHAHAGGARKQGVQIHVAQFGAGALRRDSLGLLVLRDAHTYPARLGLQAVGFALFGGPILVDTSIGAVLEMYLILAALGVIVPGKVAVAVERPVGRLALALDPRERVVDVALCAKLAQALHKRARPHKRRDTVMGRASIGMDAVIVHNHLGERVVKQEALGRRDLL